METKTSRFRLCSSAFVRPDEDENNKMEPKRIYFLSVEGDYTEREYFENLNRYLDNSIIKIEVLRHRRGDGYSDPIHVIELLNEYMQIREGDLIPEVLPKSFTEKYSKEFIELYLNEDPSLEKSDCAQFKEDLFLIGIDLEYRKYLATFNGEGDFFGIVIDRDCGNHSRALVEQCIKICNSKGYKCYMSNPCFEFWLLLHLCNPVTEFSEEELEKLYANDKISKSHTATSFEVSKRAHHNKRINKITFDTHYFPKISCAMTNAKKFSNAFPDLLENLGTNIPDLLCILGFN